MASLHPTTSSSFIGSVHFTLNKHKTQIPINTPFSLLSHPDPNISISFSLLISMARILSQTLIHDSATLLSSKSLIPLSPTSRLLNLRNRSTKSQSQNHLIEVDLSSSSSEEAELLGMRRLEDAIHGIIVRRSAPDWLPFVPGASYWVPPRRNRSLGLAELVGRLANPLSDDESMALTTVRGWPSSSYFVEGASPHPVKKKSKKKPTESEDEES